MISSYRRAIPVVVLLLTLCSCGFFGPAAPKAPPPIASPIVAAIMTPNDPNLPYPIYASFSEIEPLFRQNDGITYVINFWATWCRPCITEMPFFEQLASETKGEELQVIMVSLDKPAAIRTTMKAFVADRPLLPPVVSLTDDNFRSWIGRVDPTWRRGSIPVTLFYRNGQRYFNTGQISNYAELTGLVDRVR